MPSPFLTFLVIYGPSVVTAALIVGLFRIRRREGETGVVIKPLGDFVDLTIPITKTAAKRAVLCSGIFLTLTSYLFLDYTALFPSGFQMEVFFDSTGVDRSLSVFDQKELEELRVSSNYQSCRERYFQQLDSDIQKVLKIDKFFGVRDTSVHSSGRTTFVVEKTQGFHNYHIVESRGELNHIAESPNRPRLEFITIFEKLNSRDDYLRPSAADLLIKRRYLLRPLFKQMLAQDRSSLSVTFRFTVVGATKLYLLPWPQYSNTVYLANFGSAGLVPVAYAIYR